MEGKSGPPTSTSTDLSVSPQFLALDGHAVHQETPGDDTRCQYSVPVSNDPDELLRLTVSAMMAAGDIDAATALLEVARRRKAPLPDNVHPLSPSARKGGKS